MPHTYASISEFKNFLRDNGSADLGTTNDATFLSILEGASRAIDGYCDRSRFGSGFGPRIGTNRYDSPGIRDLWLSDDLLSITSISTYDTVGGSADTLTDETDVLKYPYDRTPYRKLILHEGSSNWWGAATRGGAVIVGKWGYADERVTSSATTSEALDTSETGVDVSSGTAFSIGQTILVDSEQMYVTGISANTLTVTRAANGTTAATHSTSAAIDVYVYPRDVRTACLLVAQRRWKARDAGLTGTFTGDGIGITAHQDSELSILARAVGHLRVFAAG